MGGISDGFDLYPPSSTPSISNGNIAPVTMANTTQSGGKFWNIAGNVMNMANSAVDMYAKMSNASKGIASPIIQATLPSNLGAYSSGATTLAGYATPTPEWLSRIDTMIANSQTLNRATQSMGQGVGSSLSDTLGQYKNILIVGGVIALGLVLFKKLSK